MSTIYIPKNLANASYNLPPNALKLMYLGLSKLHEASFFLCWSPPVLISANEWQDIFPDTENPYRDLKRGVIKLNEASITFEGKSTPIKIFSSATYVTGEGVVELEFSNDFLRQCGSREVGENDTEY